MCRHVLCCVVSVSMLHRLGWVNDLSSVGTSSFHDNGMEGEDVGSSLIGCVCNLSIKKGVGQVN